MIEGGFPYDERPILVLSGPTYQNGSLKPDDTLGRINHGIKLAESSGQRLFAVGGCSEEMSKTARKQGVENVIAFGDLRDTVGNALNARETITQGLGYSAITVVTADYHMPRATRIFERVLPSTDIDYSPSTSEYDKLQNLIQFILEKTVRATASNYFLSGFEPDDEDSAQRMRSRLKRFAYARNSFEGVS